MNSPLENLVLRERDLDFIFSRLARGDSCALVGLSNMGKSSLLRALPALDDAAVRRRLRGGRSERAAVRLPLFVYIDCNLMLELTGQGFYEAILRALLEALQRLPGDRDEVVERVRACYQHVVDAGQSAFQISLNFNEAIAATATGVDRMVVFLLDEFDEAFGALDGRVFLNLRALDDKYGDQIAFITATVRPLSEGRQGLDSNVDEFCELFTQHTRRVGLLEDAEARRLVRVLGHRKGATLSEEDAEFVLAQAGGHPGLISATVQALIEVGTGRIPAEHRARHYSLVENALDGSDDVRRECGKLWSQLSPLEQEAAMRFITGGTETAGSEAVQGLLGKGVLVAGDNEPRFPGRLFADYVRRQRRIRQDVPSGVWIDVEAGDVWVDGRQVPALTDLEYRLLLLLYGRIDKISDKYQIVEAVWGQDYIDEVDDARIEKLISRLRGKIETDPANPRYLVTVRGRGYKLVRA